MVQERVAEAGFLIDGTDTEVTVKGVLFKYDWASGSGVDLEGAHACAEALGQRDGEHKGKMLTLLWTTSSAKSSPDCKLPLVYAVNIEKKT